MGTMISSEDTMKDRLGKLKNKKIRNELLQGYIKKHLPEQNLELITGLQKLKINQDEQKLIIVKIDFVQCVPGGNLLKIL